MKATRTYIPKCQKKNWTTADCLNCLTLWKIADDYCLIFPIPHPNFWTMERYRQRANSSFYPGNPEINEELWIPFLRVGKDLFWVISKQKIVRGHFSQGNPEGPRKIVHQSGEKDDQKANDLSQLFQKLTAYVMKKKAKRPRKSILQKTF